MHFQLRAERFKLTMRVAYDIRHFLTGNLSCNLAHNFLSLGHVKQASPRQSQTLCEEGAESNGFLREETAGLPKVDPNAVRLFYGEAIKNRPCLKRMRWWETGPD